MNKFNQAEHEQSYIRGGRMAWTLMLQECLKHLGYDDPESMKAGWIIEREATVMTLRELCDDFGDNDWRDNLNLSDVIEKHLAKHLYQQSHE
jgi:hypothetical protein